MSPALAHLEEPAATTIRIGGREQLDWLAPSWRQLCKKVGAEPFLSPDWVRCYLQSFEPTTELVVISVCAGEKLLAVLPLTRKWIWFHGIHLLELKGAANAHSVLFDVLRLPGAEGEAATTAIWQCLRDLPGWHILHLPYLPQGGPSQELLTYAAGDGFATLTDTCADSPVLRMHNQVGQMDPHRATSSRYRSELRRGARRLEAELGGKPKLIRRTHADASALAKFYNLEATGWKGRQGTAIQSSPATSSYYRRITRVAERLGQFSLHSLEIDGRMLAACFGLEIGSHYHGLKLAYDESLRSCGPGHLILSAVLEDCARRGVGNAHLGGKMDSYKRHWTSETEPQLNGFIFNSSLRSQFVFHDSTCWFPALRRLQERFKP